MSPSRDLTPKGLAIACGQQYVKENGIYVTFANKVAALLGTLPGATVVEGAKTNWSSSSSAALTYWLSDL